MFKNIDELKCAKRLGKHLYSIFDELLASEQLLKESEDNPFQILKEIGYFIQKEVDYLDMSTTNWCKLSTEKQIRYTSQYQKWYAQNLEVEQVKIITLKKQKKSFLKKAIFVELTMGLIPPGKYWQGSTTEEREVERENEERKRVLISKPFWCGRYCVTQKQWFTVMKSKPSKFKGDNHPVERVSWEDCQKFCKETNLVLLTEAQWEYAARGGVTSRYSFGENKALLEEYAWYSKNSGFKLHPVGKKRPNAYGLYDIHGNVWEWCLDLYKDQYDGNIIDPLNNALGTERVIRGGAWYVNPSYCRTAFRSGYDPDERKEDLSFRVSKSISF